MTDVLCYKSISIINVLDVCLMLNQSCLNFNKVCSGLIQELLSLLLFVINYCLSSLIIFLTKCVTLFLKHKLKWTLYQLCCFFFILHDSRRTTAADIRFKPHGKESTDVWITQNKGKESENSYWKLKSFCVFAFACPTVISSIFGKSFHFPFPCFVI